MSDLVGVTLDIEQGAWNTGPFPDLVENSLLCMSSTERDFVGESQGFDRSGLSLNELTLAADRPRFEDMLAEALLDKLSIQSSLVVSFSHITALAAHVFQANKPLSSISRLLCLSAAVTAAC